MRSRWTILGPIAVAVFFCLTCGPGAADAEDAPAPPALRFAANPDNIAPTIATEPHRDVRVYGEPRMTAGHPNTLWDEEDILRFRQLLKTSAEFRQALFELEKPMDERIGKPIDVPPPQKGPDGAWLYPGDYFPDVPGRPHGEDPVRKFSWFLERDSKAVASLGILYALTGGERYAKYARDLLVAYSNLPRYGPSKSINYRWAKGLGNQDLEDALDLEMLARGYDLIYNSPSVSPDDRTRIHDELIQPLAWVMLYPILIESDPGSTFASQANNRGAIGATAVLLAGYATDDQELVDAALYGTRTTLANRNEARYKQFPPPKDCVAATADHPSEGLLTVHLAPAAITGGMWVEGSPSYALYALVALINAAEAGWRHGLNLYGYNNAILKTLFDFPLMLAYPDMTLPGENDSRRFPLRSGELPTLYEYGYLRYRDPRYLMVINAEAGSEEGRKRNGRPQEPRRLIFPWLGSAPPSILYDLDPRQALAPRTFPSVNFPTVGYGVLRVPAPAEQGMQSLTLSYGPSASHGHPDKLHIDLWALGDILMPSPGVQFPYNTPADETWHWTTLSHNTLTVDETSQRYSGHWPHNDPARADETVFGPGESVGVERAWSASAYPGVTMDRSICLTGEYLADLFGAFSDAPHTYDLAWHIRGEPSSDLPFADSQFPAPAPNGYNAFTRVRRATPTSDPWSVAFGSGSRFARLAVAGGATTEPILGEGGVYADWEGSQGSLSLAPTLIERRERVASTIFGNVLDFSATGAVKSVSEQGDRDAGFGLMQIQTADGQDSCFASYRPGAYSAGGVETDALQALIRMRGPSPRALYLGGGTFLKIGDAILRRSSEGLAYVEQTAGGGYVVGNPSPESATVTVRLKALIGLEAFDLDGEGKPKGKAPVAASNAGEVALSLEPGARIGFFPPGENK